MIKNIITMLNGLEHYGKSEVIEIAKGKYEMPFTIKKGWNQIKRNYKWHKISK
jgi:hypothetical protein